MHHLTIVNGHDDAIAMPLAAYASCLSDASPSAKAVAVPSPSVGSSSDAQRVRGRAGAPRYQRSSASDPRSGESRATKLSSGGVEFFAYTILSTSITATTGLQNYRDGHRETTGSAPSDDHPKDKTRCPAPRRRLRSSKLLPLPPRLRGQRAAMARCSARAAARRTSRRGAGNKIGFKGWTEGTRTTRARTREQDGFGLEFLDWSSYCGVETRGVVALETSSKGADTKGERMPWETQPNNLPGHVQRHWSPDYSCRHARERVC